MRRELAALVKPALDRTGRVRQPEFPLRLTDVDGLVTNLVG
jgi:hypothetical protein